MISDLDQRTILSQVQFCLTAKAPCNAKGEYFIPDFVAVREMYDPILKKNYLDIIIFDTKLSKGTSWSPNQIVAQKMESWVIKSVSDKNIIKGIRPEKFINDGSVIKNGKFRKIFKDGAAINID